MPDSHLFDADVIIIGGGIVGAATAMQLKQQHSRLSVVLLEKESQLAQHQTGRNSGVIHAGVYYQPGSMKAQFCKQGAKDIKVFCQTNDIPYQITGKLIVATTELEFSRLKALSQRCEENEINHTWLTREELVVLEPNVCGLAAIKVDDSGIVDYQAITQQMINNFIEWGGKYWLDCSVSGIQESAEHVEIDTSQGRFKSKYLICCGGLMSDRLARMANIDIDFKIIPFKGEYFKLPAKHNDLVKHLIYPVPDPKLPFLGVHLTPMIDGSITVGPNAIQTWKREAYSPYSFNFTDAKEIFFFSGYWRLIRNNFLNGLRELKNSFFKPAYLKLIRKYTKQIKLADLQAHPCGVRAQAVSDKGELIHDFLFKQTNRSLHVCNAPSPAATSSLPIGRHIIKELDKLISVIEKKDNKTVIDEDKP